MQETKQNKQTKLDLSFPQTHLRRCAKTQTNAAIKPWLSFSIERFLARHWDTKLLQIGAFSLLVK